MINKSYEEWRRIHNRAAKTYIDSEWSRENLFGVAKIRRRLLSQASGSVLDVACGYGNNFPYLIHARHITGVDFSQVMLDKARRAALGLSVPIELREGGAEALDFPDNSFDTVISSLSTCSFYDPITALQEIRRVCKADGQILLIEHGRSSWSWLGNYQDRHVQEQIEQGGCRWNQEPQDLVRAAGIQILRADRTFFGIFHSITASPSKAH